MMFYLFLSICRLELHKEPGKHLETHKFLQILTITNTRKCAGNIIDSRWKVLQSHAHKCLNKIFHMLL